MIHRVIQRNLVTLSISSGFLIQAARYFTNSLFHVTQAVNVNELDSQMYTAVRSDGDYTLYDANYKLPFAMSVNKNITRQEFQRQLGRFT